MYLFSQQMPEIGYISAVDMKMFTRQLPLYFTLKAKWPDDYTYISIGFRFLSESNRENGS